jgi:hypothetical protein
MPLSSDGLAKIRYILTQIQAGQRFKVEVVGFFTLEQLAQINAERAAHKFPPLSAEIKFQGKHMYNSRCVENGYTIGQILDQIESAFSDASVVDF